jgi:AraC-like DNA-binding protein
MRLAEMQDVNILGALAFAIRNAANVRDAVRVLSLYLHYHAPVPTLVLEEHAGPLRRLVGRSGHAPDTPSGQYVEHAFCLICRSIRTLTGGQVRARQVLLHHAPASSADVYRRHFGVVPDFEQEVNAIVLTERDLVVPFTQANRPLQALVEHYLDAHSPASGRNADQQVRHTLARLMRISPTSTITDVADVLRTHPRTLQRKLKAQGVTFEQLRDEIRRTLAEVYLSHGAIPIAHVAELIGYAEQSVFTRSCLRWFGKTPLAIRKELTERG